MTRVSITCLSCLYLSTHPVAPNMSSASLAQRHPASWQSLICCRRRAHWRAENTWSCLRANYLKVRYHILLCLPWYYSYSSRLVSMSNFHIADDFEVRFYEGPSQNPMWEGFASFTPKDIHQQVAVKVKIPQYRNPSNQRSKKQVNVTLRRKNKPEEASAPRKFIYLVDGKYADAGCPWLSVLTTRRDCRYWPPARDCRYWPHARDCRRQGVFTQLELFQEP